MTKSTFAPTSYPIVSADEVALSTSGLHASAATLSKKTALSLRLNYHIIKRLTLIWLLISTVVGAIVVYFELDEIDAQMTLIAQRASENIVGTASDINQLTSPLVLQTLQKQADELVAKNFSIVEVYDTKQSHLVGAYGANNNEISSIMNDQHHKFPLDSHLHHESFWLNGSIFQQMLIPLRNTSNETFAYFEGVYKVDEATMNNIKSSFLRHLLLVIGVGLATSFSLYPLIMQLNRSLYQYSDELLQANIELMQALGNAIALRDAGTNGHNYRVTLYAIHLAEAIDLDRERMRDLIAGSFLHDVGKIGISDLILRKADKLTDDERDIMRQHVDLGTGIVKRAKWLKGATEIVQYHHEKFDGSGYPNGLKGQEIPTTARIFTIVDVFDALTSERPYKQAFTAERALSIMEHKHPGAFDPYLLHAFLKIGTSLHARIALLSDTKLEATLNEKMRDIFLLDA